LSLDAAVMDFSCIKENLLHLTKLASLPDLSEKEEYFITQVLLDDSLYIMFQLYPLMSEPAKVFELASDERRAFLLYRAIFNNLCSFAEYFCSEVFSFLTCRGKLVNDLANMAALLEENPETWYLRVDSELRKELTFYEKMFFSKLAKGARPVDMKSMLGYDPSIEKYHFFIENPKTAYLRIKLKQAIAREDYELAAKIWQEIKKMESES